MTSRDRHPSPHARHLAFVTILGLALLGSCGLPASSAVAEPAVATRPESAGVAAQDSVWIPIQQREERPADVQAVPEPLAPAVEVVRERPRFVREEPQDSKTQHSTTEHSTTLAQARPAFPRGVSEVCAPR